MFQVEGVGGGEGMTQEIINTFESILAETVLVNRIF